MAKVIADRVGYFGNEIREVGDEFNVPDAIWNDPKKRPSWASLKSSTAAVARPADDDEEDGKGAGDGGQKVTVPADWNSLPTAERKALAKAISGENAPNAKEADKVISAYVEANAPEPFADARAPETAAPVRVKNEINDATGATQPDWVAPASSGPRAVAD